MICDHCGSTSPRFVVVRKIRIPVCSVCTPRHEGWWCCRCSECSLFRINNPDHNWLDDYDRSRPPWYYLTFRNKGTESTVGGVFYVETAREKQELIDLFRYDFKIVVEPVR